MRKSEDALSLRPRSRDPIPRPLGPSGAGPVGGTEGRANVAVALGVFLFAIFLSSASAHTYSPDEESLVYVTQAFVTRGDFNIPDPDRYPVVGGHRGVGGKIYSGTGPAQSLMAVPFYVLGREIANAFDVHFRDFILRVVTVSLFNSLISALTGILLFAWMRRLGFSRRVGVALVLVYSFSTLAWVYARAFYSEPLLTLCFVLAVFSFRAYHDTRVARWMIVAGLAAGLATLTKLQGVLVLPALALYLAALEFKREPDLHASVRNALTPGMLFVGALALGLALTGYLNFIRFGDPLQSGRGQVSQDLPIVTGLYGLLLSSGKSVFLYAPPVVLFFFALPRFFRRYAAEALFCAVFIATFVLFHARLEGWSGDGAWGPRYLVSTMPFWILPIGARLGEWWRRPARRALVVALIAGGLLVNALGLTVNFDTYIQIEPNANARYFNLESSPLLAHWNLLRDRVSAWWGEIVGSQDSVTLVKGFLATGADETFPRYLAPRALVLVKSGSGHSLQMSLLALDYRPEQKEKRRLVFWANGAPLESQLLPATDSGYLNYRVQIPAGSARWAAIDIVTLGSQPIGKSPMGDELGVHLQSLEVSAMDPSRSFDSAQDRDSGHALPVLKDVTIPPLPTADPKAMWAWFYQPANAQFDFIWWYLYFTGLDDAQVAAIMAFFTLAGIMGFVLSAPPLWRVFSRGVRTGA
jgi:hypothetical protein